MTTIRALIVDDEPLARRGIRQLLAPYTEIAVVGECRDGFEAVRALASTEPDLVFLDVQMPGLDGLGVIRAHGVARMPLTVFVTAHDEFAVRAFEAQALDYLVKPISAARFRETVARVRERLRVHDALALATRLSAVLAGDASATDARGAAAAAGRRPGDRTITVPTPGGERLLDEADVDWIEARDYHAEIHAGGTVYRVREPLAALEASLDPARFVRIHRSVVVRLDLVREWGVDGSGEARAILRDGTRLRVSRRRLATLKARLRSPDRPG